MSATTGPPAAPVQPGGGSQSSGALPWTLASACGAQVTPVSVPPAMYRPPPAKRETALARIDAVLLHGQLAACPDSTTEATGGVGTDGALPPKVQGAARVVPDAPRPRGAIAADGRRAAQRQEASIPDAAAVPRRHVVVDGGGIGQAQDGAHPVGDAGPVTSAIPADDHAPKREVARVADATTVRVGTTGDVHIRQRDGRSAADGQDAAAAVTIQRRRARGLGPGTPHVKVPVQDRATVAGAPDGEVIAGPGEGHHGLEAPARHVTLDVAHPAGVGRRRCADAEHATQVHEPVAAGPVALDDGPHRGRRDGRPTVQQHDGAVATLDGVVDDAAGRGRGRRVLTARVPEDRAIAEIVGDAHDPAVIRAVRWPHQAEHGPAERSLDDGLIGRDLGTDGPGPQLRQERVRAGVVGDGEPIQDGAPASRRPGDDGPVDEEGRGGAPGAKRSGDRGAPVGAPAIVEGERDPGSSA